MFEKNLRTYKLYRYFVICNLVLFKVGYIFCSHYNELMCFVSYLCMFFLLN